MSSLTRKYRPYFTLAELETLVRALRTSSVHIGESPPIDLVRYLDRYILDIRSGHREANHTLAPTIAQKLGFTEISAGAETKPDPATLYLAWQSNATLTVKELSIVQNFRYLNDLMSETEEDRYEKANGLF